MITFLAVIGALDRWKTPDTRQCDSESEVPLACRSGALRSADSTRSVRHAESVPRLATLLLWGCMVLGLAITIGSLAAAASWMGSSADEAPIVWLPALVMALAAFRAHGGASGSAAAGGPPFESAIDRAIGAVVSRCVHDGEA